MNAVAELLSRFTVWRLCLGVWAVLAAAGCAPRCCLRAQQGLQCLAAPPEAAPSLTATASVSEPTPAVLRSCRHDRADGQTVEWQSTGPWIGDDTPVKRLTSDDVIQVGLCDVTRTDNALHATVWCVGPRTQTRLLLGTLVSGLSSNALACLEIRNTTNADGDWVDRCGCATGNRPDTLLETDLGDGTVLSVMRVSVFDECNPLVMPEFISLKPDIGPLGYIRSGGRPATIQMPGYSYSVVALTAWHAVRRP